MSTQTVFKAGNSNVVAIPSGISKSLGLKPGVKVVVDEIKEEGVFVVRKKQKSMKKETGKISKEFKTWLKDVLQEDAEILDELSVR